MVCTSLGSLLHPLFYFLCSNLKANLVGVAVLIPGGLNKSSTVRYNCDSDFRKI